MPTMTHAPSGDLSADPARRVHRLVAREAEGASSGRWCILRACRAPATEGAAWSIIATAVVLTIAGAGTSQEGIRRHGPLGEPKLDDSNQRNAVQATGGIKL
jgi:hypothetical protein